MDTDRIAEKLDKLNNYNEELLNTLGERYLKDNILDLLTELVKQSKKQTELLDFINDKLSSIDSNTDRIQ